ncbi:hypothetical protein E2C01_036679 [Portunus trituberculatus]|uniref:Uncharacterized protein n=1 Tax=Portunus trituberculatus TaxID=210409 RepID=A0A5B7FEZ1_PORTR|nr:hypothetical protein [Portunus trituberculatus]
MFALNWHGQKTGQDFPTNAKSVNSMNRSRKVGQNTHPAEPFQIQDNTEPSPLRSVASEVVTFLLLSSLVSRRAPLRVSLGDLREKRVTH